MDSMISLGIGPVVSVSPRSIFEWVLVWCVSGVNNVTDEYGVEINMELPFQVRCCLLSIAVYAILQVRNLVL